MKTLFFKKRSHDFLFSLIVFLFIFFLGISCFFNQPSIANAADYQGTMTKNDTTVTGNVTGSVVGNRNIIQGDVWGNLSGNDNKVWGSVNGTLSGDHNEIRKNAGIIDTTGDDNVIWGNISDTLRGNRNIICNNVKYISGDNNTVWGTVVAISGGFYNIIKNTAGGQGPCTTTTPPARFTPTPLPPTPTPPRSPTSAPTTVLTPTGSGGAGGKTYTIQGSIFNDVNKNGIKDAGETNFIGISTITASQGNVTTNADGTYIITNLVAGTVTISYLSLPTGYNITYPLNGPPPSFQVTVGPGCTVNGAKGASCQ
ncbi:MAG: SdrD B-like domain-containing protein [Candidatus Levyibacteriota bacterium]